MRVTNLEVHWLYWGCHPQRGRVGYRVRGILKCVCVCVASSIITTEQMIFFFFAFVGITGPTGVAFVSFLGMESFLDESFFQDPQIPLANFQSKLKMKMNSRIVQGIMTGEKKDGFSDPVIYMLENIEVCEEVPAEPPPPIYLWRMSHPPVGSTFFSDRDP